MASYKVYSKDKVDEKIKAVTDDLDTIETGLESLGETVNTNYDTLEGLISDNTKDISELKTGKQDKLTAGTGVKIVNDVISADVVVGGDKLVYMDAEGNIGTGEQIEKPTKIGLMSENVEEFLPLSKMLPFYRYVVQGYTNDGYEASIIIVSNYEMTSDMMDEFNVYNHFVSGVLLKNSPTPTGQPIYLNGEGKMCVYESGEVQLDWSQFILK